MNIEIRLMQPDEHAIVARFFRDVWHETQAPLQDPRIAQRRDLAFFEKRVQQRADRTLVALDQGQLAGFASWTGGDFHSLFVAHRCRSSGVGAALLAVAETEMAKTGATFFELHCICGNGAARRFYERHGWRLDRIKEDSDDFPDGTAVTLAWMMVKP